MIFKFNTPLAFVLLCALLLHGCGSSDTTISDQTAQSLPISDTTTVEGSSQAPGVDFAAATTGPAAISYPLEGAVLSGNSNTIYMNPNDGSFNQWQVTIGANENTTGLFDSGVLDQFPWELSIGAMPTNGIPVTMRVRQRRPDGPWVEFDTVYATNSDTPQPPTPSEQPEPLAPTEPPAPPAPPTNEDTVQALTAVHRNGQTFLTWTEIEGNVEYNVYRHTAQINSSNLSSATKLTTRWGPLDANTSVNIGATGSVPRTYVIGDLNAPLRDNDGLFVHTTDQSGAAYYAVTSVVNGSESNAISSGNNSLTRAVNETLNTPQPVLAHSTNGGSRLIYTQYMDYANWNPTHSGYGYNYYVVLPSDYDATRSYPLLLNLHAYGESLVIAEGPQFGWPVIQLYPNDPGFNQGTVHSWWYGFSADHNYNNSSAPTSGVIANFTEQRVMQAVSEVITNPRFNVSTDRVHGLGNSMGASGVFSLGMRYGNIIAGVYGSQGMTNYRTDPVFQEDFVRLWGSHSANLPVVNRGPYSSIIQAYDGTGVWDWMNHQQQLSERRADPMGYLMIAQGKADPIIDWQTQGAPLARALNDANVGFSARFVAGAGHSWLGFAATVHSLFGFGNDDLFAWRYPVNMSFPAISNASESGSLNPGLSDNDDYNLNIEWATPQTPFAPPIVDRPGQYEISIRSLSRNQTADITPRKAQGFVVIPGERCSWATTDNNTGGTTGSGSVTVDSDALLTVRNVPIGTGLGTRLAITCP